MEPELEAEPEPEPKLEPEPEHESEPEPEPGLEPEPVLGHWGCPGRHFGTAGGRRRLRGAHAPHAARPEISSVAVTFPAPAQAV